MWVSEALRYTTKWHRTQDKKSVYTEDRTRQLNTGAAH